MEENNILYRCFSLLLFCMMFSMISNAEEKSTRVVDGIIETTELHDGDIFYIYTTHATEAQKDSLVENTEGIHDAYTFGVETNQNMIRPIKKCRDYVFNEFLKYPDVREKLAGMKIAVMVYSTNDGSTILNKILCRDRLLDKVDAKVIHELIRIIESYKFDVHSVGANHYMGWAFPLIIPK